MKMELKDSAALGFSLIAIIVSLFALWDTRNSADIQHAVAAARLDVKRATATINQTNPDSSILVMELTNEGSIFVSISHIDVKAHLPSLPTNDIDKACNDSLEKTVFQTDEPTIPVRIDFICPRTKVAAFMGFKLPKTCYNIASKTLVATAKFHGTDAVRYTFDQTVLFGIDLNQSTPWRPAE